MLSFSSMLERCLLRPRHLERLLLLLRAISRLLLLPLARNREASNLGYLPLLRRTQQTVVREHSNMRF
ncbi:hypothetical protein M419DRAFT_125538 [Trichoderma reesei RUT C-30]|uniref:Uncharacterized protein n=1 Tax=Hypocrea jecorina (strain ATCC 56765 / BCRC 32924 / NRRL 11460 / Rut C-30) TaxID=1344414 RepID=A0A024RXF5_HYPJR|nr:hypothetical protein M419DRAFT_125538 [Trichoderma reesei RUT C-30]